MQQDINLDEEFSNENKKSLFLSDFLSSGYIIIIKLVIILE